MNKRKNIVLTFLLAFMVIALNLFSGSGALHAHAAGPVGNIGPSEYTTIFSYTDTSGTTKSINEMIGRSEQIGPILDKIGITNGEQDVRGGITKAETDSPNVINVYEHEWAGWFVQTLAGDENEHHLTVTFKDEYQVTVKVTSHKHHWTATGDKTDTLTIVCDDPQNCYFFNSVYIDAKAYTAQIIADDATYDGKPHGAEQELQTGPKINFPTPAVTVEKDIHYVGIDGTTYAESTTPPTNAGKYKAYYEVKPLGQEDVFTVQTEYTIKKADIKFDPAPTPVSNLTYTGADQELYTLGTAKSPANGGPTFPIKYWYATDSSQKYENQVLKGKDVGTVKINYQAEGDANHNTTDVKTLEIKIGKRPVKVSGITASSKTYDGKTAATLDCSGASFENILTGHSLTVSAKGNFADKNAGDDKTVNITDMTLGGTDADKYTLDTTGQQGSTTANIRPENAELTYTGEEQAPKAEFEFAGDLSTDDGKAYTGDDVQPVITGKNKPVGSYKATVSSLSGENASNYKLDSASSNVNKDYEIIKKKLTVDWKDIEKEYAAEGLEPEWDLPGIVGGDKLEKNLTLAANSTELVNNEAVNAGTYKATLSITGDTAPNYEITNPTQTFTITKAPLTLCAKGWIYYGDIVESKTDIQDLGFDEDKCEGFKGDEGLEVLGNDVEFSTDYKFKDNATGVDGAKYNLIPQIEETANYTIANKNGELKVYPKPVALEWTHEHAGTKEAVSGKQAFTYDGKHHTYTAAVTKDSYVQNPDGQQADPDITVETYQGNSRKNANAKTGTDKYTAEALTLSNPNYALTDKNGKEIDTKSVDFTIAQLPIALKWSPAEFTYNGKFQTPEKTIANLQTDEKGVKDKEFDIKVKCEKTSKVFDKERGESIEAGNWKVTAISDEKNQLKDANYTLAGGTGLSSKYVIKPTPLIVTAKNKTITYGQNPANAGVTYSGFMGKDSASALTGSALYSYDYYRYGKPGSYTITPSGLSANNYVISYKQGTLKVNNKVIRLMGKGIAKGKNKGIISWNKVTGATSYEVWFSKCNAKGKKNNLKKVATVKGTKWTAGKLAKNTHYKFRIVAKTSKGKTKSSMGHFATGNKCGKYTNAKKLSVNKTAVTIAKGKTFKLKAKVTKAKKTLKLPTNHAATFRYITDNPKVAKISETGVITGVEKGWCRVYVQTINGIWKTCKVTVN